jgi:type III secretory pathway component EscR
MWAYVEIEDKREFLIPFIPEDIVISNLEITCGMGSIPSKNLTLPQFLLRLTSFRMMSIFSRVLLDGQCFMDYSSL